MQRVSVGVVRGQGCREGDGFEVYGDRGGGQVDWLHPLTGRTQLLWDGCGQLPGHVNGGHLAAAHLCSVTADGHTLGTHLLDTHLRPAFAVNWQSEPYVFGRFQHAVVMVDRAGNAQSTPAVHSTVINSWPEPPRDLVASEQLSPGGAMRFRFTPAE